jgi:hypothetical protein
MTQTRIRTVIRLGISACTKCRALYMVKPDVRTKRTGDPTGFCVHLDGGELRVVGFIDTDETFDRPDSDG